MLRRNLPDFIALALGCAFIGYSLSAGRTELALGLAGMCSLIFTIIGLKEKIRRLERWLAEDEAERGFVVDENGNHGWIVK